MENKNNLNKNKNKKYILTKNHKYFYNRKNQNLVINIQKDYK